MPLSFGLYIDFACRKASSFLLFSTVVCAKFWNTKPQAGYAFKGSNGLLGSPILQRSKCGHLLCWPLTFANLGRVCRPRPPWEPPICSNQHKNRGNAHVRGMRLHQDGLVLCKRAYTQTPFLLELFTCLCTVCVCRELRRSCKALSPYSSPCPQYVLTMKHTELSEGKFCSTWSWAWHIKPHNKPQSTRVKLR